MESKGSSYEVDSLKIRIPIEEVEILNPSLSSKQITIYEDTGEEVDSGTFKKNCYEKNENGIKTKFLLHTIKLPQYQKDFLIILFNSKILKKRYFEGITRKNIKIVYDYLMSLKVVYFPLDTFLLESKCYDTDFKGDLVDKRASQKFDEVVKAIYSNAKMYWSEETLKMWTEDKNKGFQFSDRETTSISKKPFWKLYHKELQLKNDAKSKLFYGEYIFNGKEDKATNRMRVEFTIKNAKHFELHEITDTSLNSILNLSQEKKREMLSKAVDISLGVREARTRTRTATPGIKPREQVFVNVINFGLLQNLSYKSIERMLLEELKGANKTKHRKTLKNIYNEYIIGYTLDKQAREIEELVEMLIPVR